VSRKYYVVQVCNKCGQLTRRSGLVWDAYQVKKANQRPCPVEGCNGSARAVFLVSVAEWLLVAGDSVCINPRLDLDFEGTK